MKLIEGWQTAYKLYSVQLGALIALLALVQGMVLPAFQAQLGPAVYAAANGGLAVLLAVARVISQVPTTTPAT